MTNLIRSLLSVLLIAAPLAGTAEQLKPNELRTNITGITAVAAPPKGFDPIAASDRDLAYYGFPPRPDGVASPKALASWQKAMVASKTRIVPKLEATKIYHKPVRMKSAQIPPSIGAKSNTAESSNWSGYVYTNSATSYGSASLYAVEADFIVPIARVAFGTCTGVSVYSSNWVGIDGDGSDDVLQAGTESDADCSGGSNYWLYSPWFEWYPYGESRITNLPTSPGDDFYVEVWSTTSTAGHAYLVNSSTNQAVSVNFSAPSGTALVGNSAEWVVERPAINGSYATLTNYVSDVFWDAYANDYAGDLFEPSSVLTTAITMVDNSGNPISYPTLLGSATFLAQDEGSAF